MGLIKSTEAPPTLAAFSMKDIEAAARAVLLRAQHKAEQIIAAAQTEAEQLKQQALTAGFSEGHRQGVTQGTEEGRKSGHAQALAEHGAAMTQLIKTLTQAIAVLDEDRDDLQTKALTEVVNLSCSIARRVTKRQGSIDPQVMCENLKNAMSLAVHAADVRVAVHPSQFNTLNHELPNLKLAWPQLKHVELIQDASIAPGGVRIFTTHGQVDGNLDAQLDRIVADLMPHQFAEAT
jgi:flagellar assembly protein FliH